ncbi:MAG: KpsF/GutQ family sugar-phosphate isomerase [Zavarzinella sp.]
MIDVDPRLAYARQVLEHEANSIMRVAEGIDVQFTQLVDLLWDCTTADGRIAVTGVGKSADIAQKVVGTLNSTGTRAYLIDITRALHGDLGMIHPQDSVLILSKSGDSEEIVKLLPSLRRIGCKLAGLCSNEHSTLAKSVDLCYIYGPVEESSPYRLAPSTSALVSMALGQALAFCLCEMRNFSDEDFARFHPAGSLGFRLAPVEQYMRKGRDVRIASDQQTVREVFAALPTTGRRTGAVMLVDGSGRLSGLFTDSDLARLFEKRLDHLLDSPILQVMTRTPMTITCRERVSTAITMMRLRKISELPVVDDENIPLGLLDITDLIGYDSQAEADVGTTS